MLVFCEELLQLLYVLLTADSNVAFVTMVTFKTSNCDAFSTAYCFAITEVEAAKRAFAAHK